MKELMKMLAVAAAPLLFTPVNALTTGYTINQETSFRCGVYRVKDTLRMNVIVEKEEGNMAVVSVYDDRERLVERRVVGKKAGAHAVQLDFTTAMDGRYKMVVTCGKIREERDIVLTTARTVEVIPGNSQPR